MDLNGSNMLLVFQVSGQVFRLDFHLSSINRSGCVSENGALCHFPVLKIAKVSWWCNRSALKSSNYLTYSSQLLSYYTVLLLSGHYLISTSYSVFKSHVVPCEFLRLRRGGQAHVFLLYPSHMCQTRGLQAKPSTPHHLMWPRCVDKGCMIVLR